MRTLSLLALLAGPLAAQPLVLDRAPTPDPVLPHRAEVPGVEPRNTILLEAGGMSVAGAVRYERLLTPRFVGTVGLGFYSNVDVGATWVPLGVSVVQPVSGRFRVDAGLGIAAGVIWESLDAAPVGPSGQPAGGDTDVRYRAIPVPTVGVRYEGPRLHARLGGALLVGIPNEVRDETVVFPWPALSAGYRF